ncbi:GrpB family protein [Alkalibacterium sp. MB6]|uniref:GrpB family protein n=1 Tax=Alkalibacterium sp. MB6 TaxID=2081965 RepID=UPI00137ABFE8|nr:GrpB family protein [Alkalibacterium sp. MB6]
MQLGLGRNEVRLVPHHYTWNEAFDKVKRDLINQTSLEEHQIEHIGSTAIKGIQAKPIIDSLVGIQSIEGDISLLEKELRSCGFYRLHVERPGEIVFARFTDKTFTVKTHYIHLTTMNGDLWNELLFFRNYLNAHSSSREEYESIKVYYAQKYKDDIEKYTDAKQDFVKSILSKRS